jgi:hypothetical protein
MMATIGFIRFPITARSGFKTSLNPEPQTLLAPLNISKIWSEANLTGDPLNPSINLLPINIILQVFHTFY